LRQQISEPCMSVAKKTRTGTTYAFPRTLRN
jgi:hypothetical protein